MIRNVGSSSPSIAVCTAGNLDRVLEKWDTIKERSGCLATDGSTNIFHQLNADSPRTNAGSEARSAV